MTAAGEKHLPKVLGFAANLAIALAALLLGGGAILYFDAARPALHSMVDTSVTLTGALVALLFWDMSRRTEESWPLFLAISFAYLALGEALHMLTVLGGLGAGLVSDVRLRAGTWGPPAHLLPIGVGASLLLRHRPRSAAWLFAAALGALAILLTLFFFSAQRYAVSSMLGITRPTLILVPLLWIMVGWAYWRQRKEYELARAVAPSALILALAHGLMLFSRAPGDSLALVAHLGKAIGEALLLFNLMQIGAADTVRRRHAEEELLALNRELDARVTARDAEQRRSRALIEAIIEHSPAVIYVKDLAGRYLMINRRYADIFQLDRADVIGKTDHDLFAKDVADAFRAMDVRVARMDRPLTEEETAPLADGPHSYISVKSPLRDEAGQTYAVFGISTDITDRRRAEEALLASEQRNRLVVESALDAVVTIGSDGTISGWNPQAEATFGWSQAEVVGRAIDEIVMAERFREPHRQGLARYLATGEEQVLNRRVELQAVHRDGHAFPVELSITPIRLGDTVSFTAFVRDITDRYLAAAKLQSQLGRLHLLEQITRAIGQRQDVQSIFQVVVRSLEERMPADFVCISRYDRVGHLLTVAHVGTRSAAVGRELGIVERAEIPIDENGLLRCVSGQLVYEPDIAQVEFPFPRRLAREGLRSLVIAPLMFEDEVFGVLAVARKEPQSFHSADCEFLKQLAGHVALAAQQIQLRDSLQQAYDDLKHTQQAVVAQERLRAIGQMASGIAHDINNAISPVAIYTQALIESEADARPEMRDYLELVLRVTRDIAATVGRMRDFYRSDADDVPEPLDLNTIVPQVIELTRARWSDMPQQRGVVIAVSSDLEADLPLVMGHAAELREALTNLVFNAVDAMPEGGTITIRTQTRPAGTTGAKQVRLEVADTGAGMTEATRLRCLDPFFTTKGERGTGLGLAMVQGTAQRHKAQLDIDSAPGSGTRVRLDFAAASPKQQRAKPAAPRESRPLRLLLVDDDPAVLASTVFVLKLSGHDITAADGGDAGIEAVLNARAAEERFDAVITDLGMPYVDGHQVAAAVKEQFPDTPVILLTGWGRRMTSGPDAPAHVDFVLPKPLDLNELRQIFAGLERRI